MLVPSPTLERAFQIARSGACASVKDIRNLLEGEGFANIDSQLDTLAIRKALTRMCAEARADLAPRP
jgi:5,10-methenyltetrahydromethanopterin hydrogenase